VSATGIAGNVIERKFKSKCSMYRIRGPTLSSVLLTALLSAVGAGGHLFPSSSFSKLFIRFYIINNTILIMGNHTGSFIRNSHSHNKHTDRRCRELATSYELHFVIIQRISIQFKVAFHTVSIRYIVSVMMAFTTEHHTPGSR
jgi:hypothetical protein